MNCWRYDLWQKMTAYIHGELPAGLVGRLEDHLSECEPCRLRLERVRKSDQLAAHLPPAAGTGASDSWNLIESRIQTIRRLPDRQRGPRFLLRASAGVAALLAGFLLFLYYGGGVRSFLDRGPDEFYSAQYREVPLSDIPNTAEPHVYTEGYVSEVRMDREEGDTMFRLVDDLNRPNHFIVCEIIPPLDMKAPQIGSKIRVYGVSRFDGKAEHQWFELHPVLNIEPIR